MHITMRGTPRNTLASILNCARAGRLALIRFRFSFASGRKKEKTLTSIFSKEFPSSPLLSQRPNPPPSHPLPPTLLFSPRKHSLWRSPRFSFPSSQPRSRRRPRRHLPRPFQVDSSLLRPRPRTPPRRPSGNARIPLPLLLTLRILHSRIGLTSNYRAALARRTSRQASSSSPPAPPPEGPASRDVGALQAAQKGKPNAFTTPR